MTVARGHHGESYDAARDGERLDTLRERVLSYLMRHGWVTLEELQGACGGTVASVSAKMRDLRGLTHGGWNVERRYVRRGLFEYRLGSHPRPEVADATIALAEGAQ